jgi:hypothetical protein
MPWRYVFERIAAVLRSGHCFWIAVNIVSALRRVGSSISTGSSSARRDQKVLIGIPLRFA